MRFCLMPDAIISRKIEPMVTQAHIGKIGVSPLA